MPTEWREGKEKFERGHVGDDQLLRDTQECGILFKGTQVKASIIDLISDQLPGWKANLMIKIGRKV